MVKRLDHLLGSGQNWAMKYVAVSVAALWVLTTSGSAADYTLHSFRKIVLTDQFWAEGAHYGDFNRDGHKDVVYGPFWWEGPQFQTRHEYRPATNSFTRKRPDGTEQTVPGWEGALGSKNAYSDDFITYTYDFNRDGWDDILIIGLPGTEAWVFENPQGRKAADGSEHWPRHRVFNVVDNESPMFADVTGDGRPELLCNTGGYLGYVAPDWSAPFRPWQFHPISPKGKYHKYTHGIGYGDVNGDGRVDILESEGWWEQPASLLNDPEWKFHRFAFTPGGGAAQMYAYDVNGDGRADVITCLDPHKYGLVWWEQQPPGSVPAFKQHLIMGSQPQDSPYGVRFSQPHAIELVDLDGDGLKDIVTGKRFWAHGPTGDVEPNAPAVLYWFRLVRGPNQTAEFVPYLIDDNSGVGTQFAVGDLNGDGLLDIVTGNKRGGFVFLHQVKAVSREAWEQAQPKRAPGR
jgi:hypothetical protein